MATRQCADWEVLGFSSPPHLSQANGTEQIFRCYSSKRKIQTFGDNKIVVGSNLYGNCFFAPKFSGISRVQNAMGLNRKQRWTASYLESQLNAWFWGNDFDRVAMFRVHSSVDYWIGPVGQNTLASSPYVDLSSGLRFSVQRHLAWPNATSELMQIVLLCEDGQLEGHISLLETWKVPGDIGMWGSA